MITIKEQREYVKKTNSRDVLEKKEPESATNAKTSKAQDAEALFIEDVVEISTEAKSKADELRQMMENMRDEMKALREGLKQAREAGEGAAAAWKEKIICLQIAMRIMSGNIVPEEDHRYLRERDIELYSRAIQLRIEKKDPDEYDRLSEDEKNDGDKTDTSDARADSAAVADSAVAAIIEPPAQPSEPPPAS